MADTKLSALTEATEVGADDLIYVVVAGDSRKVTKSTLLSDPFRLLQHLAGTVQLAHPLPQQAEHCLRLC